MRYFILFLLLISRLCMADSAGINSTGSNSYKLSCDKNYLCSLSVTNKISQLSLTFPQKVYFSPDHSYIKWHGSNILEIQTGVGSGVIYSQFVDFNPLQLTEPFLNAIFIDSEKKLTIIQDQNTPYTYLMVCIFNNKVPAKMILNNATLDVGSYKELNSKQLKFGYYDQNGNYKYKTVFLNLNCQ